MQLAKHWKTGAVAATALLALLVGSAPAQADPAAGTNPTLDGFGSDTTQDVMNAISYRVNATTGRDLMGSYNAGADTTLIQSGEVAPLAGVPRANGSGDGKKALIAAIDGTTVTLHNVPSNGALSRDDVEFARSSSGGSYVPDGRLAYIPFGVDGVSYAVTGNSVVPRDLPLGSANDAPGDVTLRNIYLGKVTSIKARDGKTYALTPLLPQPGSGTRSFWLASLGLTEADIPASVKATDANGQPVQENDGAHILRNTDIAPYSIGQYSAQSRAAYITANYQGFTLKDRRNGTYLGYINGVAPQNQLRTAPNLRFPVLRPVFNIVEAAAITPGSAQFNQDLADTFAGANSRVITVQSPKGGSSVISDFGFADIPAGGISIAGRTYTPGQTNLRSN